MGVFGDWAEKYWDIGLATFPCGNGKEKKGPFLENWSQWCREKPTDNYFLDVVSKYGHADRIGLPLGPANGLVAFDFDYAFDKRDAQISEAEFNKDLKNIERKIASALPYSPVKKVGRKGFTAFYKWNPTLVNLQVNRNGVRLFDFLSEGRQTVIPPSLHSIDGQKALHYRWTDQDIMHALDEIPDIDMGLVQELAFMLGTKDKKEPNGRHGKLFWYVIAMAKIEKDRGKLIELMIKKDLELNSSDKKGPYLADKDYHKSSDATKNADYWLNRIFKFNEKFSEEIKQEKLSPDAWAYFFKNSFFDLRKDILSKKIFVKNDSKAEWTSFDPLDGVLRAYATDSGLAKTLVKDEMARFSFNKTDCQFLCDLPKWDGFDYVSEFCKNLKSPNFTSDEIADIFKEWGSNVFSRIENSKNQNRCIILKGRQNMGKDTFVRSMFEGFSPYYEQITPPATDKDFLEIVSRLFIIHIEEFDQTAKVDIAFLKSLITQPSTFFRESYGKDPNRKTTAPSFISTVNPDDFFRDSTGNRRFIVIPLDGIEFNYPRSASAQVIAQFKAIYDGGGFRCPDATESKIKTIIDGLTPEGNEAWIEELWLEMSAKVLKYEEDVLAGQISQVTAGETFLRIAKMVSCSPVKVRRVLKSKGFQGRSKVCRFWYSTKMV